MLRDRSSGQPAPALSPNKTALEGEDGNGEAGDMTCAICLEEILVEDLCVVKGCEHIYCGAHAIATLQAHSLFCRGPCCTNPRAKPAHWGGQYLVST